MPTPKGDIAHTRTGRHLPADTHSPQSPGTAHPGLTWMLLPVPGAVMHTISMWSMTTSQCDANVTALGFDSGQYLTRAHPKKPQSSSSRKRRKNARNKRQWAHVPGTNAPRQVDSAEIGTEYAEVLAPLRQMRCT